jgi:hypothetical protein
VLVVRHPLTRMVGLWMHYCWVREKPDFLGRDDLTWPEFVLACAEDHPGHLGWFYRWTITRLIEPVDRLDGTIRYEQLEQGLREWTGDVSLESPYHKPLELNNWYADDRIRDLATAWGQADRLRFGY